MQKSLSGLAKVGIGKSHSLKLTKQYIHYIQIRVADGKKTAGIPDKIVSTAPPNV